MAKEEATACGARALVVMWKANHTDKLLVLVCTCRQEKRDREKSTSRDRRNDGPNFFYFCSQS